jgi:hypothetical protein
MGTLTHRAEPDVAPVPPRIARQLPTQHGDPLDAVAQPDALRKVRPMIEELARLKKVERGRVRHVPIHDAMRRVIHERRKVAILIKPEHRRRRTVMIVSRYPACGVSTLVSAHQ